MILGAISSNDYVLGWCQQLLQSQFTFLGEEILDMSVNYFIYRVMERVPLFTKNACLVASQVNFGGVGMSKVSYCGRAHDAFQMDVTLYQVSNPCLTLKGHMLS